jgi:hypothetical protein
MMSPIAEQVSPCLPVYDVTRLHSFISRDGTRCVCVYEAADAEAVRHAYRAAGANFDNAWPPRPFQPADEPNAEESTA